MLKVLVSMCHIYLCKLYIELMHSVDFLKRELNYLLLKNIYEENRVYVARLSWDE